MSKLEDIIARLEQEIAQRRARHSDLAQRKKADDRKAETRRKIIYGAALLAHVAGLPSEKQTQTFSTLHKLIARKADREFLGLAPLQEPPAEKKTADETPDMFSTLKPSKN